MIIKLASESGFCFGVQRAIDRVLAKSDQVNVPIRILNEIVHNRTINEEFQARGIHSVNRVEDADDGVFVISAHGVSPEIVEKARDRNLEVLDVTCPLVTKIHRTVARCAAEGYRILLLGDEGHDEVAGIRGVAPEVIRVIHSLEEVRQIDLDATPWAMVSQTTQSQERYQEIADWLSRNHPQVRLFNTICDATEKRQDAMRQLAAESDIVFVVGSQNSANCNRLREIAESYEIPAYLIEDRTHLSLDLIRPYTRIGVSAGASTPDKLIQGVLDELHQLARLLDEETALLNGAP